MKKLSTLGHGIVDDLLSYNKEIWCKTFFSYDSKCDFIDNNMSRALNSWIIGSTHKVVITMFEEIRVDIMARQVEMNHFVDKWVNEISPMTMNVLEENIKTVKKCIVVWNLEVNFEI